MRQLDKNRPVCPQICELLCVDIVAGVYDGDRRLPSVRELAAMWGVNPNTVQKALQELEEMGLLVTLSTNGRFVTIDEELIAKISKETINEEIEKFYKYMEKLGLGREDVNNIMNKKERV